MSVISGAGNYYHRVHVFARSNRNVDSNPGLNSIRNYYELPYWLYGHAPGHVAVVGAGMGNDVAAGLGNGAQKIDAIDIGHAILMEGKLGLPPAPHLRPPVRARVRHDPTFLARRDGPVD